MIGQTILHYTILEKLGEGGMGVVYKAQDTKLDRTVALKFLPRHLNANEAEQARFLQEAKAAAQINHPNVCSIIDIQEFKGEQFIVMECIEGQTMRAKIRGAGIDAQEAVGYAIQIAEALAEAHGKGIVHRDIKCENIMLNARNQVKVMDFGLAKLKGSLKLTKTSSTVGTLAYMAPEQIQGGEVDQRSDIFSFGVVLFEMVTGHMPFRGEHEASMMYSILNEEPEQATKFRPELPVDLLHVLNRSLEKDPADRYQTMNDLLIDLRRVKRESTKVSRATLAAMPAPPPRPAAAAPAGRSRAPLVAGIAAVIVLAAVGAYFLLRGGGAATSAEPGKKMMAVLPFENMGAPDQEYFADGITEEITSRLSGLSGLGVIARTSAMQYKKTTKSVQEIGKELGIEYALQGTIRWSKDEGGTVRVRISPALVRVADGTQVWSQPYDAVFADVFKLQSDISTQVAGAMGVTLLQPERQSLETKLTENAEAYDLFLRGSDYYRRSYLAQDFRIAIEMFQKAVSLDPKFAVAYARLGETHAAMFWFYYDHSPERLAMAKTAIDEAIRLDPNSADAHFSLAFYYYWGFLDYDNALREFAVAEKIRPNDSRLLLGIASVQRRQGKMELAGDNMAKAVAMDPRSSEVVYNTAQTYVLLRRYTDALQMIDRAIPLAPDVLNRYIYKAGIYLIWNGDTKKATGAMEGGAGIAGFDRDWSVLELKTRIAAIEGRYDEALTMLRAFPDAEFAGSDQSQFEYVPKAQLVAEILELMGKKDPARQAYDSARVLVQGLLAAHPEDPRYHSALGIALAGLGRNEEALREAKAGVDLMPMTKEAWRGSYRLRDLARVYVMTGQYDAALDALQTLLAAPTEISPALLKTTPVWAPLRGLPRFQKLVAQTP
jgi:TolB-like protein/tetratricopeptide (TPR) repeat protein/tRNA A-37 threonylcarbamoyl transferase component Bud32